LKLPFTIYITNFQIDLEDLSGPENLKELLNMICKEGFDLFSSPLAEKKYSLNQNVYAVPILCDLLVSYIPKLFMTDSRKEYYYKQI